MTATATAVVTPVALARLAQRRQAATALAASAPRLAYSTHTGQVRRATAPAVRSVWMDDEEHCFVCNRHTGHVGEHEALVEAGLAVYEHGRVYRTEKWDDEVAYEVCQREREESWARLGLAA